MVKNSSTEIEHQTLTVDWILAFTIGPTTSARYYTCGTLRLAHSLHIHTLLNNMSNCTNNSPELELIVERYTERQIFLYNAHFIVINF